MKNPLSQFGKVPVQTGALETCFSDLSSPAKKIQSLEKDGDLVRLKRGLYIVNEEITGQKIDNKLCANQLYGPSYVSLQWALRYYGLIPERVFTLTSVTTKRSRKFDSPLGTFSYYQVPKEYFSIGIKMETTDGYCSLIATPEKALCDTILSDNYVPNQSLIQLRSYLEEDIRFDTDMLKEFNVSIIEECAKTGKKTNILNNLIKIIKQ